MGHVLSVSQLFTWLWHQWITYQYRSTSLYIACIKVNGIKYEASVVEEPTGYWWVLDWGEGKRRVHSWSIHYFDDHSMYGY